MAHGSLLCDPHEALASTGATDVLVYRRAAGGRFVLTSQLMPGLSGELLLDDEPAVREALAQGLRRLAGELPRAICGGYTARAAAIVAVDVDVVVVLGRRDGCLAGVSDEVLIAAGAAAAQVPIR
jgi:hypothetical protein